jgi:hypothetical protein
VKHCAEDIIAVANADYGAGITAHMVCFAALPCYRSGVLAASLAVAHSSADGGTSQSIVSLLRACLCLLMLAIVHACSCLFTLVHVTRN